METIVADPVEFIPERTQVGLDELGLSIVDSEWGDSEHELFLIKQERGEIPGDRHPPNRTVVIKIRANKEGPVSLAEAAQILQMKVGRWQDEGGWVKRTLDKSLGFSTDVGFIVYTATLGGIGGWLMAHRGVANEITLTLTVGPYCYGTKEIESGEFKAEEARKIEWEIANIEGTAPGLIRIRAKNEGATNWMGAISAVESRYHSAAATAALMYECEELTLLGSAAKATRTGASGGGANNVVKTGALPSSFSAVLYSKNTVTGEHMTHTGNRRMLLRLWDPNAAAGNIKFRLEWRVLGSNRWIINEEQGSQLAGNFSYVDLGEVRPEIATLGSQRWEFRVAARTAGVVGEEAQMDCVFPLPTEQYAIVQEYIEAAAGSVVWEDAFGQTAGAATGKVAPLGGTYEGAGSATDINASGSGYLYREAVSDTNNNNGRFLVGGSTKVGYVNASLAVKTPAIPFEKWTPMDTAQGRFGLLLRYTNTSNWLRVAFRFKEYVKLPIVDLRAYIIVEKCVAGVVTVLSEPGGPSYNMSQEVNSTIHAAVDNKGKVTITWNEGATTKELSMEDADLKAAGALAEGKVGVYDANPSTYAFKREYRTGSASTLVGGEEPQFGVCWPGRQMEFRSDGVFRQHATDDVWSRLVPDGFLPVAPPSGLEARAAKGILIPSVGNFEGIADSEKIKGSVKVFYFPAYHFTSEAI